MKRLLNAETPVLPTFQPDPFCYDKNIKTEESEWFLLER